MIESLDGGSNGGNKSVKTDSSTPVLDNFSRDLIKLAEEGKLDPVIGREKEKSHELRKSFHVERKITQSLLENLVVVKPQLLKVLPL